MKFCCPKCGYKERGLAITKKMIQEVETVNEFALHFELDCIRDQAPVRKDHHGNFTQRYSRNQIDFIKAVMKYKPNVLVSHDWIKYIDFEKQTEK